MSSVISSYCFFFSLYPATVHKAQTVSTMLPHCYHSSTPSAGVCHLVPCCTDAGSTIKALFAGTGDSDTVTVVLTDTSLKCIMSLRSRYGVLFFHSDYLAAVSFVRVLESLQLAWPSGPKYDILFFSYCSYIILASQF